MAVAKRQGRSEDQSEDFRQNKQNKQHSWLSPICIGQAQVEEKTYKRRSQGAFSRTLSPACVQGRGGQRGERERTYAHGRERARVLGSCFYKFSSPWACPMQIGLARSAVCST